MTDFFTGMTAPIRGLRVLLANPRLLPLALAPAAAATALLGAAFVAALRFAPPVTRWLLPGLIGKPLWLGLGIGAMFVLLVVVFGGLAWMTAALVSIPIHDRLSEQVEALHRPLPHAVSWRTALPRSIRHSVAGFLLWIGLEVALLPLHLVPVIGSALEFVLGLGITAFLLSHQFVDGTLSRQGMSFRGKMRWLMDRLPAALGLGSAGVVMLAVPGLNLLGLPVAIVGGTLLVVELSDRQIQRPALPG